jgi:hypothetical protein
MLGLGATAHSETDMAKGQQRGNREAKKPKKEKPKELAMVSPFSKQSTAGSSTKQGGKK